MFKNYLKLAIKVLMRRKMFTFINLFGIFFTLTLLLAGTAVYTSLVVTNPVEKQLSRTLFLNQVAFRNLEKSSMSAGGAMPYFMESSLKPLKDAELISIHSERYSVITTYINNDRLDIDMQITDENFWKILSFKFIEGRPYTKQEIELGQKVAVICQSLGYIYFGNNSAIGKNINLNDETFKIVGVVKDVPKLYNSAYAQLWKPYNYASYTIEVKKKEYSSWSYQAMILAKNKSQFGAIRKQFAQNILKLKPPGDYKIIEANLDSSFKTIFGNFIRKPKDGILFLAVIILLLMLPLLNLTNLTVSRIFERSSEIGVRKAFGSTKQQLAFQFLFENSIITMLGGILGFIGAFLLLKVLNASGLVSLGSVAFSFRIFLYGFITIILFGLASGLYPALKMSKLQIVETMKGGNK